MVLLIARSLHAEIGLADAIVRPQGLIVAFEHDAAGLENVAVVGGFKRLRDALFDRMREHGISYEAYNYHGHTDAQILELAPRRAAVTDARVLFLYLSGLDHHLHFHIHDADSVHTPQSTRPVAGSIAHAGWGRGPATSIVATLRAPRPA